jgi:hypothetical protein
VKVASPSPEALFASGAAGTYQSLLAGYGAVSGPAALGIAFGSQKIKIKRKERMFEAVALYPVMVAATFFVFPNYESEKDSLLPVLIQGSL